MQIHYFQRYHSKENVDTANTMLMLSRLYNYNADKFFSMLSSLILKESETPEITFDLQVAGGESVPDAIISQKSFKVIVETKLYNEFSEEQLIKHLSKFDNESIKVLLTLDPKPMNKKFFDKFALSLQEYNSNHSGTPIKHVNLTFEQLLEAMEEIVDDRDVEIVSVLDDFRRYCFEEHLIPEGYKWMRAIVAGTTFDDNIELSLYYDKATRGYSQHGYIGLYADKRIKAIGKLSKIVEATYENGNLIAKAIHGSEPTNAELENIKEAIRRSAKYGYDYDLLNYPHNFFIVERFYELDFRKASKYPIQKSKYFNLAEMLKDDKLDNIESIIKSLDGKTWEDFE